MRDREFGYRRVVEALAPAWGEVTARQPDLKPSQLCQIELGLRLLHRLDPRRPADDAWVLFGGYPFARAAGIELSAADETMLAAARHLLWTLRRHRRWVSFLDAYRAVPLRLRGYRFTAEDTGYVPEREAEAGHGDFRQVEPRVAADRFSEYDAALERIPRFARRRLPLAGAVRSSFTDRRRPTSVSIPAELITEPSAGHDLSAGAPGPSKELKVPREELRETARWMDSRVGGDWERRLSELRLALRDADSQGFSEQDELPLDSLLHLVGMVGAGKSTLMILVAVWAARQEQPLRTTLVVGDVAEQLRHVGLFRELGLPASPVLGTTTRETHVQRLHRRQAARGRDSLLLHDAPGFDDLSTVCLVDALRGSEAARPLRYADAPCTALHPEPEQSEPEQGAMQTGNRLPSPYGGSGSAQHPAPETAERDPLAGKSHGCPLWSRCPRHGAARDQVDALIWVANPASLVQTQVSPHLNEERLRQLELACLRSDIIFVDEADRVQMSLDEMFAPSATLVTRGLSESWLDQVQTKKIDELAQQGRLQLTEREIARWDSALTVVATAANRLYAALIDDEGLREWADTDYFSSWTLLEKLLAEWFPQRVSDDGPDGVPDERVLYEAEDDETSDNTVPSTPDDEPWAAERERVRALLNLVRDDPLGNAGPYEGVTQDLVAAVHELLHTLDETHTRARVREVLDELVKNAPEVPERPARPRWRGSNDPDPADVFRSPEWYTRSVRRLSFTLLLCALQQRLDRLTWLWPQVEAALHLDTTGNELSRRPPQDYAPLVPEAPMGNVLGFQYLVDSHERAADAEGRRSGTLRFFRCAGVGRELLLSLSRLGFGGAPGAPDGQPGPRIVLMSGTSWAGTSTRAHVLAPVGALLLPDDRALKAIRRTVFRTRFLHDPETGRPLSLSGQDPTMRPVALRTMISRLAGPTRSGLLNPLEEELREIKDENRRRALLLVGSYREATAAANQLQAMDRWQDRVRVLAADDAELDAAVRGTAPDGTARAIAVRRGDLASFAEDSDAELLIAPLLAVERGHNILNRYGKAAFGTVLFLARPHPRPDDLYLSVFAINDWVTRFVRDLPDGSGRTFSQLVADAAGLDAAGRAFRRMARQEWRRLLTRRYIYTRLSEPEKESFTWDQLVTIWQVVGRLVRGGVPARVVFVDARFAPALAAAESPNGARAHHGGVFRDKGLLPRLREVLDPYFTDSPDCTAEDTALVRTLYQPLHSALCRMRLNPTGQ